jgi:Linear amide C-N hydrolases, choloylglycine hydrolase family.
MENMKSHCIRRVVMLQKVFIITILMKTTRSVQ